MSGDVKRVSMIVPDEHPGVHDGLGGVHKAGSHPVLPADVANAFIAAKVAVPFSAGAEDRMEARRELDVTATNRRAEAYKPHAEAIMQNHDNLSPERQAAYYRDLTASTGRATSTAIVSDEDDDTWADDDFSIETPSPEPQHGSTQPTTDGSSTPSRTSSPSSETTKRLHQTKPTGGPAATSGSKRRSR